ncbi:hypothetical protein [Sphingomonas sp. Leaf231]|uniref:hypothetical protein n=1 Tax=Sphingomonas sp. Leaf231 TaxID=1736301 RepID=UPI0012E113D3|nr:hypothetical protein [Sphingomonas sp. Leaf231]
MGAPVMADGSWPRHSAAVRGLPAFHQRRSDDRRQPDKGPFCFDIGATVNVTNEVSMFVKVDNLFDRDPEPSPQTHTGLDVNPAPYDMLGRVVRIGVRRRFRRRPATRQPSPAITAVIPDGDRISIQ